MGVVDKAAAPVWAGMQQASLETGGKVSYLEVDGPQTAENASTFLATLTSGDCDLILAAGSAPAAAVQRSAGRFTRTTFVAIRLHAQEDPLVNVVTVREPDDRGTTARVRSIVAEALSVATRRNS